MANIHKSMYKGLYPDLYLYSSQPPAVLVKRPDIQLVDFPRPLEVVLPPLQIPGPNKEPIYPLGYLSGVAGTPSEIPPLNPLWWANIEKDDPRAWCKAYSCGMVPAHSLMVAKPAVLLPLHPPPPPPLPPPPPPPINQRLYYPTTQSPQIITPLGIIPMFHCPIDGCKSDFTNYPERIPQLLNPYNSLNSHLAKGDEIHRNEYTMRRKARAEERKLRKLYA